MSERSDAIARTLAMLSHARRSRQRRRALVKDRTLQTLVADRLKARTAAGMRSDTGYLFGGWFT